MDKEFNGSASNDKNSSESVTSCVDKKSSTGTGYPPYKDLGEKINNFILSIDFDKITQGIQNAATVKNLIFRALRLFENYHLIQYF